MAEINDRSEESPEKAKEIEDRFKKKLSLALSELLEESLSISDDTILEKLFTHLVTKIKSDGNMRKTLTVYVLWLCLVMKRWTTLQSSVQVFAIRLAGVVASTPVGFFMLEEQLVIAMLTERVFIQETQCDSSLMLGVVNFITEAVKHQVGCNWVIQTEIWRRAVQLCHTDTSLYTTKASAKFITHLVLLFERTDKDACHLVIDAILRPLSISKTKEPLPSRMEILKSLQFYVSPDGVPTVYSDLLPKDNSNERTPADSAICRMTPISTKVPHRTLLASIRFLNEVLYSLLKSQMSVQRVNDIFKDYSLEMWAWEQVHVENDDVELLRSLSAMLTLLNFLGTEHTINGDIAYCDIELLSIVTLRLIEILIYKRQYTLVFDICVHCHKLRGHVVKNVIYKNTEIEKPSFDLGNQLIIVQGLPLFVFVKVMAVHCGDVMDKYAEKLFAVSHNETLRACYQFRDMLRRTPNINISTLSQQAVVSMMRCIDHVNREQAVIIFQTMMHVLRQFVPEEFFDSSSVISYQSQTLVQKCPVLLMHLLDCITIIINRFHITWHESLETLCLLKFNQALISNPHLTPRLCAQTLKLIQLVIEKFIPPNLALLVNTLKNSSIVNLGSLLLSKLHDSNWEVRDSALEVLQVIGRLSDIMFPPFQTLLLESNLLDSVVDLVVNDLESYVRGTSLICLCEMVKVQNLWDKKLSSMSLSLITIDFMKNETEGLVRKAACQLITSIYKHQKISPSIEKDLHYRMFHSAIHDLYWEVKVSALDFWEAVFDHELTNEGMIDGAFPGFTFSKQTRQIISLTRQEIHKCLARVLDKLARVGCLQVLWTCLHDECDLQVVRAAVRVIHKLMDLLLLHSNNNNTENTSPQTLVFDTFGVDNNFTCKEIKDYFSDDSIEDEDEAMPCETTQNVEMSTDNAIDQIVEHDDIDLLSTVYKLNSNWEPTSSTKTQEKFITAKEFLKKIGEIDIDEMVNCRSTWLENSSDNLESLLDDVLAVNNDLPEHINNVGLDCY